MTVASLYIILNFLWYYKHNKYNIEYLHTAIFKKKIKLNNYLMYSIK